MSTRIHKVLGYGVLEGVDRQKLADRLWEHSEAGEVERLIRGARDELHDGSIDRIMLGFELPDKKKPYPTQFHDIVHYADYPDDDDGWHVIVPPREWKTWYRWDNTVDYYEAGCGSGPNELDTVVKELGVPLYPYQQWMDKNTGERLIDYSHITDRDPNAVPMPPLAVRLISEHLEFPSWKLLRPVLIRWWS